MGEWLNIASDYKEKWSSNLLKMWKKKINSNLLETLIVLVLIDVFFSKFVFKSKTFSFLDLKLEWSDNFFEI
jgi:hypothetical protein